MPENCQYIFIYFAGQTLCYWTQLGVTILLSGMLF